MLLSIRSTLCKNHSIDWEWNRGLSELTTRQVCQATISHPQTNEKVWFNQAHLFHITNLDEEARNSLLEEYGEEEFAKKMAKEIVIKRKEKRIQTTFELVEVIKRVVPKKFQHGKIHCATKSFQALRIAVNDEYGALTAGLEGAWKMLVDGGRMAVIAFHSGEDRIVKHFFKKITEAETGKLISKKPITPSETEVTANPRSRSAKLRIIQKNL